jgi:hypothetical protein
MPALHPHPASPHDGVSAVRVAVIPGARRLQLHYHLDGDIARLRIPPDSEPVRATELWRHTCFEAFLLRPSSTEYFEYNFSPSGAWAAYRFAAYRQGMADLTEGAAPLISCRASAASLAVAVTLDLDWLQDPFDTVRLGLTAVIEDRAQVLSYWALKHASEKPDFHRAECFVAALA